MNINRHNYESCFLLYVDNELTAAERAEVEAFMIANPDLQGELELLQQTVVHSSTALDDQFKQQLLRTDVAGAAITEEQLLLLLDDELAAGEKHRITSLIAADATLTQEFQQLQRTQLTADTGIVFPDKSSLYRHSKPARVLYLGSTLRRWSAAAAVLLLLGTGFWLLQRGSTNPLAQHTPAGKQQTATPDAAQPSVTATLTAPANEQQAATVANNVPAATAALRTTESRKTGTTQSGQQQATTVAVQLPGTVSNQVQEPTIKPVETVETIAQNNPDKNIFETAGNNSSTTSVSPVTNTAQPVTYALYSNEDAQEEEETGLLTEERQRSSGLKGIIKRARRTLERRTGIQSNSSEVRFAVFAVNTN